MALANSLAVELGGFGIRVNSVHPYGTDTPMANDTSVWQLFVDHPTYIHSFSPGALPTESLADPGTDLRYRAMAGQRRVVTGDGRPDPADKGYIKI